MERLIALRRGRRKETCEFCCATLVLCRCDSQHSDEGLFEQLLTIGFRAVFVSFGGLLLYLEGPYKKLAPLRIDYVYLLLKK